MTETLNIKGTVRDIQYTNEGERLEKDIKGGVRVEEVDTSLKDPKVRKAWLEKYGK